jgi:2-dehydropantoate 2-reductase
MYSARITETVIRAGLRSFSSRSSWPGPPLVGLPPDLRVNLRSGLCARARPRRELMAFLLTRACRNTAVHDSRSCSGTSEPTFKDGRMPVPQIAVIGPGAIGGAFAAAAWQAGERDDGREIVLCARRRFGQLVVTRDGSDPVVVDAPVRTDPSTVGSPADWVFLAVKAHQTGGARDWLRALAGPATVVVVLQNGVEHRERVEPLAGDAMVLPAVVRCPAEAIAPGRVRLHGQPQVSVPDDVNGRALARLLDGGAEVSLTADFTTEMWRKLCENAVAGLMVLTGRRAAMFRRADVAALARDYALECVAVARAEGARLADSVADTVVSDFAAMSADRGSSIVFDREAGRPLEWEARNGVVRRAGARHGIPTPVSDVLVPLLAAASG